ncbi:alkaline phosphatase family protein [Acidianus manzaensis]|uniref:Phosphodiesterase n=1 Tax=Acidianus manzaensis TaxID=282676 RepID=A0A1W6K350_9CREN|nr:alkaline phosphatase family protein [Acidianus manzaensis]ARM76920.1 phosphodiesterase [Acidianus manzaensis]
MIVEPYLDNSLYSLSKDISNALNKKETERIQKDKVLLILIDGLGYSLAERINFKAEKIHSVFPTITITVLTTLLTAQPPGKHGIMGWRIFDKENGKIINLIDEYYNQSSSINPYLSEEDVILAPALRPMIRIFSKITKNVVPYFSPWDAISQTYEIAKKKNPRFMFLYLPFVDAVSHHFGPYSEHTLRTAKEITNLAETLANDLKKDYSVIITADHGHIPVEGVVKLDKKEIIKRLDVPPFGDYRNLMLITRENPSKIFENYPVLVLKKEKLAKITGGENVPDYAVVPTDNRLYMYWDDEEEAKHLGSHGGMNKEEIEIPLLIKQ